MNRNTIFDFQKPYLVEKKAGGKTHIYIAVSNNENRAKAMVTTWTGYIDFDSIKMLNTHFYEDAGFVAELD